MTWTIYAQPLASICSSMFLVNGNAHPASQASRGAINKAYSAVFCGAPDDIDPLFFQPISQFCLSDASKSKTIHLPFPLCWELDLVRGFSLRRVEHG
ncbi:hypothetical protein GGP41_005644 [Bipolaris sorokiniana]|uniref:Uncharacterized protein n=1 Tax=Cochliobolus sativus TaxID=45130 RepID=A0A8H6DUE4_COCSA|nr:hypothetical protein GGP41_005644 [Bipolaris sorokiniana]